MLKTIAGIGLAAATLVAGSASFAAVDYFLKIKGVEGEATEATGDPHKGEIEILSWSWGETNADGDQTAWITTTERPVAIGLLLPAVQKVREPATKDDKPTTRDEKAARAREIAEAQKHAVESITVREVGEDGAITTWTLHNVALSRAPMGRKPNRETGADAARTFRTLATYRCKDWAKASGETGSDCTSQASVDKACVTTADGGSNTLMIAEKQTGDKKESGEKAGTEDINIGVGELQECADETPAIENETKFKQQ